MGVATGCGCKRYIDFLILLIPTPLVSFLFAAASLLFVHFLKCFISMIVPTMCMTSDPYAASYTFARSALTGAPPGTKRPYVRYIYIYIYTDSEIIVLTRWGSLRLAPIIYIYNYI